MQAGSAHRIHIGQVVRPGGVQISLTGNDLRHILVIIAGDSRDEISAFGKIGERHQVTISKINLAVSAVVENGCIQSARAALGAVAPHAYLSEDAAAFLGGKPLTAETGAALGDLLSSEVERVIAGRGSMPYKREAVRGLAQDVFARLIALAQERGL